ncbi:MAG TPA: hypothetical protein VFP84_11345 [Kofleriaceae bacterium]|nr:hypothetical protein [Kofleriaceae bacterium]
MAGLALGLLGAFAIGGPGSSAQAAAPRTTPSRPTAETLTALPAAGAAKPLRAQRRLVMTAPSTAPWRQLSTTGAWQAAWDRATGVPAQIWGSGLPAPGASASPAVAETFARGVLAAHLALLAPGAALTDFVLVSNTSDGDVRSVGFAQRFAGRAVVGGQISVRFKRDRLFVIASSALPHVALPAQPRARLARGVLQMQATAAAQRALALPAAPVGAPGDEVVLPLVADDAVIGYRLAVPVTIDGGADGKYLAYADPATGEPLATRQMNLYASATLLYHGVDRYPERGRLDRPAAFAHVIVDGAAMTTSHDGAVSLVDAGPDTITTAVIGDRVAIVNKDGGALAHATLTAGDGEAAVWDASAVTEDDAQLNTFLNVNAAKDFARVLDPALGMLDAQITANVNIQQDCNAFFDGKNVNFFHASTQCQNTGLIEDVVYHEFGHALHSAEIVDGVGAFDGAMSEGAANFFAAQITGDPKVGRGFFYSDDPLRDLDPDDGSEARWPDDIGEIHHTGIIFGGAFWDLRKALIAHLGEDAGIALTHKLFIGALRRSIDIPSSLVEVLASDDDDGDLSNGTPHECEIRAAFGRHGLRTATGTIDGPATLGAAAGPVTVRVGLAGLSTRCAGDEIDHADVVWKPGDAAVSPPAGSVTAAPVAGDPLAFTAQLPVPTDGILLYQARVVFKDGSAMTLPDNLADPYYQLYAGPTVALYCTQFEDGDPLAHGWITAGNSPWVWGTPTAGATDPHAAFSGTHALVQVLDGNYAPSSSSTLIMPPVVVGQWSDVHLQYRRWLAVEDSHFDQAAITVGGKVAWLNASQNLGDRSALTHIDREWRFHDVAVSGLEASHTLHIGWSLKSDPGLELGGWAIDDVCVVANAHGVCGDGKLTAHEECDDGMFNADVADACRSWCQRPRCGDTIIDQGEECDGGPSCNKECLYIGGSGGCATSDDAVGLVIALAGAGLVVVLKRRKRKKACCD